MFPTPFVVFYILFLILLNYRSYYMKDKKEILIEEHQNQNQNQNITLQQNDNIHFYQEYDLSYMVYPILL